jgi:hypothetical protein
MASNGGSMHQKQPPANVAVRSCGALVAAGVWAHATPSHMSPTHTTSDANPMRGARAGAFPESTEIVLTLVMVELR